MKGKKGTKLRLKHGELLDKNGMVNMANIDYHYRPTDDSDPFQTDIVILSGKQDRFMPKFNYKGFQFVEVSSSAPIQLSDENLIAVEMHSDVPAIGYWTSSSDLLNKIRKDTNRSYIATLFGYPPACPQREKQGWNGPTGSTGRAQAPLSLGKLIDFTETPHYSAACTDQSKNMSPI